MKENILTRHYFNGVAEEWEARQTDEAKKIEHLLSKLDWENVDTIVDIGCGTGVLFPFLERISRGQRKIFAMDFAECMVQEAAQKKYQSIRLLCGCARYLPFRSCSIDRIVAFHVFPHIQGKNRMLKECWRVLKPGADLAILHSHGSLQINAMHREIGGAVKNHKLPSGERMCRMLESAGFEIRDAIDRSEEYFVIGKKSNYV